MKWFDKWFLKKSKWAWQHRNDEPDVAEVETNSVSRLVGREHDWHENLSLSITTANGGKIVSFRRYDHKTDRHDNKIYVVPDDLDFNAELGKMITMESMRG